jgi:hypothetical protein
MFVPGSANEGDIRSQGKIARVGDLFPGEVEVIFCEPHVFAASTDGVGLPGRIVPCRPGMQHSSDILIRLKDSE